MGSYFSSDASCFTCSAEVGFPSTWHAARDGSCEVLFTPAPLVLACTLVSPSFKGVRCKVPGHEVHSFQLGSSSTKCVDELRCGFFRALCGI